MFCAPLLGRALSKAPFFFAGNLAFLKAQVSPPKIKDQISGEKKKTKNAPFGNRLTGAHVTRAEIQDISPENGVNFRLLMNLGRLS